MNTAKIVEGVFAINKPKSISSAQVLRDLQQAFNHSKLFAPWLDHERTKRSQESRNQHRRRRDKRLQVKLGHGGTLDPMATGVLIIGVGKGTKQLQRFLTCTKSYEATILFGAATDTFDLLGKVLNVAPYTHLTRDSVEKALDRFRGSISQRPPLYSALRMDGKRLYEYAREGKEIPREIEKRPVTAKTLEIREWIPGGCHPFKWPDESADDAEKRLANTVLHLQALPEGSGEEVVRVSESPACKLGEMVKRARDGDGDGDEADSASPPSKRREVSPGPVTSGVSEEPSAKEETIRSLISTTTIDTLIESEQGRLDAGPPAARLSMVVTSGFYVRSLCHDLGQEVGSLGIMTDLVRTRQAAFELGRNVLEYDDLRKAEEVWGPQVEGMLRIWEERMAGEVDDDSLDIVSLRPT
ncbi:MAG: hypothetical protein Q9222_002180 [Ikaeria aurantiellina]